MAVIACTTCGKNADTLHILPWVVVHRRAGDWQRVEFACPDHDPNGYWFPIAEWNNGPLDWCKEQCSDPRGRYTTREHIRRSKIDGVLTADLVDFALAQGKAAQRQIVHPELDENGQSFRAIPISEFLEMDFPKEMPHLAPVAEKV